MGSFCDRCGTIMKPRTIEGKHRYVCQACKWVRYPDVIAAVSAIVYDAKQRIVLVRRAIEPGYGRWVIPGGYVERGESFESAALRETREEVAIALGSPVLSGVYSSPESRVATVVYAISGRCAEPELPTGIETLRARFFPIEEIPWGDLYFDATRRAIEDWIRTGWPTKSDPTTGSDPE